MHFDLEVSVVNITESLELEVGSTYIIKYLL